MSISYSKRVPFDRSGVPLVTLPPDALSLATVARDNASTSSVTTLNANTTTIEVAAVTVPAVIKWATNQATSVISAAGTANFDNVIEPGEVRRFVIPRNSQAIPNYNANGLPSIVGLNTAEGLYANVATKSCGVGSVLLTQY